MVSGSPRDGMADGAAAALVEGEDADGRAACGGGSEGPGQPERCPLPGSRGGKLKVSDDELVRRRQEVKLLKEQISKGARHPRGYPVHTLSLSPNSLDASKSPSSLSLTSGGRARGSPRYGGSTAPDSPRESMQAMPFARKGHFDAAAVSRRHDSVEMENLRAKIGEMEAKLLQSQSQLIKERESTRTAQARLAMEMQTRITSEEQELLRSKSLLEHQLEDIQKSYSEVKSALNAEKRARQLCEVEIDRLNRSIERGSVNHSQQSASPRQDPAAGLETSYKNSETHVRKIQELCQVNLTLVGQKRSAVKHVVAMTTEISDISWLMKECIDQMKATSGEQASDGMLAAENKALLMAQLQAQSKLQLMEAELQSCQLELAHTKALVPSAPEGQPLSVQHFEIIENVVDVEGKTVRLEEELSALKKTQSEVMVKWTARIREHELQVGQLSKALEQERARSTAQLADLQDELNSVHQSRMSESARYEGDRDDPVFELSAKKPVRSAPGAAQQGMSGTPFTDISTQQDSVPLLTLCDEEISFNVTDVRRHDSEAISIKLDISMADVENSLEFVQAVKLDLCTALGISAPRIQVHGLRAGSVFVDMTVQEGQPETDRSPRFVRHLPA